MRAKTVRDTLLEHQQKVMALGYLVIEYLLSGRRLILMSPVSTERRKEMKNEKEMKGPVLLHELTSLLYYKSYIIYITANNFANNGVSFFYH